MKRDITLHISTAALPETIKGFSLPKSGSENEFLVILREDLTEAEKTATAIHEWLHIWHGDHFSNTDMELLERIRHQELTDIAQGLD